MDAMIASAKNSLLRNYLPGTIAVGFATHFLAGRNVLWLDQLVPRGTNPGNALACSVGLQLLVHLAKVAGDFVLNKLSEKTKKEETKPAMHSASLGMATPLLYLAAGKFISMQPITLIFLNAISYSAQMITTAILDRYSITAN